MKLESLTPEQERLLEVYCKEGIEIGHRLEDNSTSLSEITDMVNRAYEATGIKPPQEILYVESPMAAVNAIALLTVGGDQSKVTPKILKDVWDQSSIFYGQHSVNWLYFYKYFKDVLKDSIDTSGLEKIEPLLDLCKTTGWSFFYEDLAVVTKRPVEINKNHNGLHNPSGPALRYSDGFSIYALNGVRFDSPDMIEFITNPEKRKNTKAVLNIQNVEQRSEIIKLIGLDSFFEHLPKEVLDEKNDVAPLLTMEGGKEKFEYKKIKYTLYSVQLEGYPERIYLKMENPSVPGDTPFEAVHPECKTVNQALHWRNTGNIGEEFVPPTLLS